MYNIFMEEEYIIIDENISESSSENVSENENISLQNENVSEINENVSENVSENENISLQNENVSEINENVSENVSENENVSLQNENISLESENVSLESENVVTLLDISEQLTGLHTDLTSISDLVQFSCFILLCSLLLTVMRAYIRSNR